MLVLFLVLVLLLRAQSGVRIVKTRCGCIWQAKSCLV